MKETRYFYVPHARRQQELPEEEALHATRVLRMKDGDPMVLIDGEGTFFDAVVTLATQRRCLYEICEERPQQQTERKEEHPDDSSNRAAPHAEL